MGGGGDAKEAKSNVLARLGASTLPRSGSAGALARLGLGRPAQRGAPSLEVPGAHATPGSLEGTRGRSMSSSFVSSLSSSSKVKEEANVKATDEDERAATNSNSNTNANKNPIKTSNSSNRLGGIMNKSVSVSMGALAASRARAHRPLPPVPPVPQDQALAAAIGATARRLAMAAPTHSPNDDGDDYQNDANDEDGTTTSIPPPPPPPPPAMASDKKRQKPSPFFNIFKKGDRTRSTDALATTTNTHPIVNSNTNTNNNTNNTNLFFDDYYGAGDAFEFADAKSDRPAGPRPLPLSAISLSSLSIATPSASASTSIPSPPPPPPTPTPAALPRPRVRGHLNNASFARLALVQELVPSLRDPHSSSTADPVADPSAPRPPSPLASFLVSDMDDHTDAASIAVPTAPAIPPSQIPRASTSPFTPSAAPSSAPPIANSSAPKSRRGNTSKPTEDPNIPIWVLQFSHDGQYLATGSHNGSLLIWSVAPPPPIPPIHPFQRAFSSAGSRDSQTDTHLHHDTNRTGASIYTGNILLSPESDLSNTIEIIDNNATILSGAYAETNRAANKTSRVPGFVLHPPSGTLESTDNLPSATDLFDETEPASSFLRGMRRSSGPGITSSVSFNAGLIGKNTASSNASSMIAQSVIASSSQKSQKHQQRLSPSPHPLRRTLSYSGEQMDMSGVQPLADPVTQPFMSISVLAKPQTMSSISNISNGVNGSHISGEPRLPLTGRSSHYGAIPGSSGGVEGVGDSGAGSAATVDTHASTSGTSVPLTSITAAAAASAASTAAATATSSTTLPNVFDPRPYRVFRGHSHAITSIAWSRGGFIASASLDRTVHLWHINHADFLCVFHHTDSVTSVAFHPRDDRYFVSGSLDGRIRLWSISEKRVRYWNEIHKSPVTAVSFNRDGTKVVAGTSQGDCVFYETVGLKYHTQIQVAGGSSMKGTRDVKITGIVPIPAERVPGDDDDMDGVEVNTGGDGTGAPISGIDVSGGMATSVSPNITTFGAAFVNPAGSGMVMGVASNTATASSSAGVSASMQQSNPSANLYFHRVDTNEKYLVTSMDSRIRLINDRDKSIARKYKGADLKSSHVFARVSDDGAFIICASEDRQVFVWDTSPPLDHVSMAAGVGGVGAGMSGMGVGGGIGGGVNAVGVGGAGSVVSLGSGNGSVSSSLGTNTAVGNTMGVNSNNPTSSSAASAFSGVLSGRKQWQQDASKHLGFERFVGSDVHVTSAVFAPKSVALMRQAAITAMQQRIFWQNFQQLLLQHQQQQQQQQYQQQLLMQQQQQQNPQQNTQQQHHNQYQSAQTRRNGKHTSGVATNKKQRPASAGENSSRKTMIPTTLMSTTTEPTGIMSIDPNTYVTTTNTMAVSLDMMPILNMHAIPSPVVTTLPNPADDWIIVIADVRGRIRVYQNVPLMAVSGVSMVSAVDLAVMSPQPTFMSWMMSSTASSGGSGVSGGHTGAFEPSLMSSMSSLNTSPSPPPPPPLPPPPTLSPLSRQY